MARRARTGSLLRGNFAASPDYLPPTLRPSLGCYGGIAALQGQSMCSKRPVLVVEDDVWARVVGIVLDPATMGERSNAYAYFMSPDEPDFAAWCERVRQAAGPLYPSDVRLVSSSVDLRTNLADACAVVTESLVVGPEDLKSAPHLKLVYKYGTILRNIDVAACQSAGVKVRAVRRRANVACAEHAFALMLALARRLKALQGLISVEQLPHAQ